MNALPAPLDNIFVLIAVLIGLILLAFAFVQSQKAKRQLEETRAKKAAARNARQKAKRAALQSDND